MLRHKNMSAISLSITFNILPYINIYHILENESKAT